MSPAAPAAPPPAAEEASVAGTGVEACGGERVRLARLTHAGATYTFREAVPFTVEHAGGLWIYGNPELRLWGYAETRDEALGELAGAFDHQYREVALEADAMLEPKAVELKRRLLDLVEVKPTDGAAGG